ncbi:M48 family metallopeptidase, partial [Megasphaera sp.]
MNMKKKAAAACVAVMAAVSLPMGIVPVQPVQADLITDVIGGLQVKSALSKQIKHYDTTKEGQSEIYQSVTKQTGVLHNEYYNERLASIMNRLSASIAQTDPSIKTLPYRWYVSPDTTFNAACTMGHVMVVNKGMFDLVSNDDEIAVVLGHEMGHGQKHHVANSTQKKVNVEIGKMVLADTIGGSGLNSLILDTVSNQIETVHIDRAAEWEADNLSFDYVTRAGYNPGATAAIWQRVME